MGIIDTIKANKANAEKASALDALEKEFLANKARNMGVDYRAISGMMDPIYGQVAKERLNQNGLAASNVANIGYQDGISVEDAIKLKAAEDAQFANDMRRNYANSKQYVADERLARTGNWDTPEVYEALKRSDAYTDNIDQGLAAEWMKGYNR